MKRMRNKFNKLLKINKIIIKRKRAKSETPIY